MAFIIRNAAGKLVIVATCGIGGAPSCGSHQLRAEYPLPPLTQTPIRHPVRPGIATDRSFILSLRQARRSTPPWRAAATVLMPAHPACTTGTQLAALLGDDRRPHPPLRPGAQPDRCLCDRRLPDPGGDRQIPPRERPDHQHQRAAGHVDRGSRTHRAKPGAEPEIFGARGRPGPAVRGSAPQHRAGACPADQSGASARRAPPNVSAHASACILPRRSISIAGSAHISIKRSG